MKCVNMEETKNFNYNRIMKDKKKIKITAQKISDLEKRCHIAPKEEQVKILKELEKITETLSLEEMLDIDVYILENNLLK